MKLADAIREKQQRIAALRTEIEQLEAELREASGLLGASSQSAFGVTTHYFRNPDAQQVAPIQQGSSVDWAIKVLDGAGRALHIDELIRQIARQGGPQVKKPTLVSNLSRYVKDKKTFVRTGPSTFGLLGRDKEETGPFFVDEAVSH